MEIHYIDTFICIAVFIANKDKNRLLFVFPSKKIIVIIVNPVLLYGAGWELRTQLGLSISIVLTVYFLPPTLHCWGEL
jgi:low affinity Fe/Cu permease